MTIFSCFERTLEDLDWDLLQAPLHRHFDGIRSSEILALSPDLILRNKKYGSAKLGFYKAGQYYHTAFR